ncbi:MAG: flagellar basal body L-ring protein FlgH [Comamonas sp.]|nr:flagellar basal body L-ring protein FlgH [Comamonas sp.]
MTFAATTPLLSLRTAACLAVALALGGCAINNPPPVDLGMPTAPLPPAAMATPQGQQAAPPSGSLYQASRYRPAFENRRARMVGDTVTVTITEKVTASQKQSSTVSRSGNMSGSAGQLPLLAGSTNSRITPRLGMDMGSEADFSGSGGTSSANTFQGSITTSVVDVLPNGHLVVAGEKQIGVNHNVDVLRFTGTVDPYLLQPNSTISSQQVANVRVESRSRGQQGAAQSIGWLSSFFLSVLPF